MRFYVVKSSQHCSPYHLGRLIFYAHFPLVLLFLIQFHHIIPHEITVREFRHIAADLNGIIGLEYGVNLILFNGLTDPAYRCVACCAVLNAYLGQLAHRQAHMRPEKRDAVVAVLQDLGLMVTPDTHRRHHKTYDQGFPILSGT
jgi:hypothetical protein